MAINRRQRINRRRVVSTNQDTVRGLQITDSSAFCQKLRVRQHRKAVGRALLLGCLQDRFDRSGRAHRQGTFFDNNRVACRRRCHLTGTGFHPAQVAGLSSTKPLRLCWCVHRNEHHVGGGN